MIRRTLEVLGAAVLLVASPATAQDDLRRLWASPWERVERLDQSQTRHRSGSAGNRLRARKGVPVAQTFVPRASPLLRMDFLLNNRHDPRPGRVRLYQWRSSHAETVAGPPLFEDVIDLSGDVGFRVRSVFPRIELQVGATYLVEFSAPTRDEFSLQHTVHGDAYTGGELLSRRPPSQDGGDLWFRTWSGPRNALEPTFAPAEPELEPSDRSVPWRPPLPERKRVRRGDYRDRIEGHAKANRRRFLESCEDILHRALPLYAFLYRASCLEGSCEESHAATVRDLLLNAHARRFCTRRAPGRCEKSCDRNPELRFWWLEPAATAALWTGGSPSLDPRDHQRIRELLIDSATRLDETRRRNPSFEVRAVTLVAASGYIALARLYPDHESAGDWRRYAEGILDLFLRHADTLEDSAQYTSAVSLPAVLQLAALSGREAELWGDEGFLSLVERVASGIAPTGFEANFGDGSGWARDIGGLVWFFEKAATRTRTPHYRWLAHRLYLYNESRLRDRRPGEDSLHASLPWLGWAWLDADEDLEPVPPPGPATSLVTERQEAEWIPSTRWKKANAVAAFRDRRVPDKLILRSSWEPSGLHAVVNLLSGYPHGQIEIGALVSLADEGSVLLADGPFPYAYYSPAREDESAPLLRRYWGGQPGPPGRSVEVEHLRDGRETTVAWLRWRDPNGWNVQQGRRIYFVRDRFLLVRDSFTFSDPMGAAAGPVWHAGDVRPEHGENWWDVYYRAPLSNVWRVRNPERYALIYFVPREGREEAAYLERAYLPPPQCPKDPDAHRVLRSSCRSTPPYVLYQRWTGEAGSDTTLWFDTLILPHGPELDPAGAADRVRVLLADAEATALEVQVDDERWMLVANPGGRDLRTEVIDTDARYALLRIKPDHPSHLVTREASRLRYGERRYEWPTPVSVELDAVPESTAPEP